MKVLVLGNSDTAGLFSSGETWTRVLGQPLTASRPGIATLTEIPFAPIGAGAPAFAERKLRELEPDVVILPVGTFAFTVGFVWVRVQSLLGARAGRWFRRTEEAFDRRTRTPGMKSVGLNRFGRRAARFIFGARAMSTPGSLAESYGNILRALARTENVRVLVMVYPPESGPSLVKGDLTAKRARFLAAIEDEAMAHHFHLIRAECVFSSAADGQPTTTPDGFHLNAQGHRLLGTALAEAILQPTP